MARKPKTFAERRKIVERFRKQQAREEFLVRGPERFTDIPKYLFQRSVERGKDQVVTGLLGQSLGYAVLKSRSARPGQRFKEFKSLFVDRTSGRMGVVGDVIRAKSRGRFDDNVTKGNADEKFEAIRNKFLGINDAVKVIDENFNKVNNRIEKLEKNAVELKNLNGLVKSVEDLDKKFDALDNKVDKQFSDFDTKFRLIMREMNQQSERVNVRGMTPRDQVVSGGGTGTGSGDILSQLLNSLLPSTGTVARVGGAAAAASASALAAARSAKLKAAFKALSSVVARTAPGAARFGARFGPIGALSVGLGPNETDILNDIKDLEKAIGKDSEFGVSDAITRMKQKVDFSTRNTADKNITQIQKAFENTNLPLMERGRLAIQNANQKFKKSSDPSYRKSAISSLMSDLNSLNITERQKQQLLNTVGPGIRNELDRMASRKKRANRRIISGKNYGTMGDDIDFGGGIPSSVGNVRRAQMNLGAKTSTRQRIGGMPPLSMRDSSRGQLDFQSQFLRQQIEQQKSQFLKFGQLPPGFEFVQGNMGRLGSAQAVAARGAMPLMGMGSGGMGMPSYGGKYGGGGNYSGGQRYNMGSVGSHVGAGSNAPGFSSPADVNFSTAKGGAMSSPSGQKYTIGNTLNVNSFYGGQKVSMGGRSFNPGNIKYSGSDWQKQALSKYMAGVSSEKDEGTNQIMFKNPVAGAAASTRLTMAYVTGKKVKNIQEYVAYYTPGNVAGHSADIAKLMGVSPTANLNWRDPNVMYRFERAKQIAEVGKATYEAMGGDRMAMRGVMHAFKNDGVSSGFVNEIPKSVTAFFETQPAGAKQPENAKQPAGANQPENAKATRGLRPAITGTRVFKANAPTKNMSGADITKKALDLSKISGFVAHDSSGHKHGRDPEFQAYRRFKREGMSDQDAYYKAYKGIRDNRTRRAYHQQFERGTVHYNPLTTQRGHAASLNSSMLGMAHLGFEGVKLDKQTVATGAAGMMKMYHEVKKEKPDMTFDAFLGMWKTHPQLGTAGTRNANPKQHNEGAWVTQVEQYFKTPEGQALQKLPYDRLMNITQEQLYSGKYDVTASSSRPTASSSRGVKSTQAPRTSGTAPASMDSVLRQGQFGFTRGAARSKARDADPRLVKIMEESAKTFPLRARLFSAGRSSGRTSGAHSRGLAVDVQLFDENGVPISSYQTPQTANIYALWAEHTRRTQQRLFPELNKEFAWIGGLRGMKRGGGGGKYGAADFMDFRMGYHNRISASNMGGYEWGKGWKRGYEYYTEGDFLGVGPRINYEEHLSRLKGLKLTPEQIKKQYELAKKGGFSSGLLGHENIGPRKPGTTGATGSISTPSSTGIPSKGPGMAETPLQFYSRLYGNIAEVSKTSGFSQNQLAAILGVPSTQKFEQNRARQAEEKRKQQLGRKALGQFTQAEINAARQEVPGPMGTRRQETDQEVRQRLTKAAINEVAVLKQEDQTKTGFGAMDEILRRPTPDFDIMDRNIRSAQLQSEQRAAMVPGVSDAALAADAAQRMPFGRNAFAGENEQIAAQRQLLEGQRQAQIAAQRQAQQAQMMNSRYSDFATPPEIRTIGDIGDAMQEASRAHPLADMDGGQFKQYGDIRDAPSFVPSTPQPRVNEFADFKTARQEAEKRAQQEAEKAQNTKLMTGGLDDANVAQKASDAANEVKEKQAKGSTATSKSQKSSSGSGTGGSRGGSGGTNHPESEPASPGSGGYGSYGRCFV